MVDLKRQMKAIREEIDLAIRQVLDSTAFINGPVVKQFSEHLAEYLGISDVIPCGNGTDALQIALMALELQPGDEVITTPFTFVATAEVIALLGLKPVFVDIDPATFNIDPAGIKKAITSRTRCILPVHLFGQSCDMDPILEIAQKHGLYVVEDNAQALGGVYRNREGKTLKTGTMGHVGTTSFYPSKNLATYGDGGAVFTNNPKLATRCRKISNHGSSRRYYYDLIGVNSRLDSIHAAILDVKLKYLDSYTAKRQEAARMYDHALKGISEVSVPFRAEYAGHIFHQYTILVSHGRDGLKDYLASRGIPTMLYYPVPLHLSEAYRAYGYREGDFPMAEKVAKQVLSLPMHTELDEEQIRFIADSIKTYLTKS